MIYHTGGVTMSEVKSWSSGMKILLKTHPVVVIAGCFFSDDSSIWDGNIVDVKCFWKNNSGNLVGLCPKKRVSLVELRQELRSETAETEAPLIGKHILKQSNFAAHLVPFSNMENELVVEPTPLKYMRTVKIGSFPQIGVKRKNIWVATT